MTSTGVPGTSGKLCSSVYDIVDLNSGEMRHVRKSAAVVLLK